MLNRLKQKYKTQSEIAKALGVSQMAVSKWQSGKTYPSRRTAQRIAEVLNISIAEVYSDADGQGG